MPEKWRIERVSESEIFEAIQRTKASGGTVKITPRKETVKAIDARKSITAVSDDGSGLIITGYDLEVTERKEE